ncbi:MAG TPA: FAD-binding oxidoreductase [Saprospiraceae bacterium]|nr:FAD-binding oxidoreductase [Saprospiraceae bacterium]
MAWKWYDGKVLEVRQQGTRIKHFTIEVLTEEGFDFTAGQFVTFDLPISEKRLQRWRSYSIANRPDQSNKIELSIVYTPGGVGSAYFFNEVEVGTILKFKGPDGAFVLREPLDFDLIMLCTGTGVAPFKSMLEHIYQDNVSHKKLHLIFGTRFKEDILYREEFEQMALEHPEFTYDIVLSKEEGWEGHNGYIHQVYTAHYSELRPDVKFYICGWSQMIDEAVANLMIKTQYDRTQILYELYG